MKKLVFALVTLVLLAVLSGCASATPAPTEQPIQIASGQQRPYPTSSAPFEVATEAPVYSINPTIAAPAPRNNQDNFFQDFGVNPLTKTAKDHLSTFALDVDTASYNITKEYIDDNSLPPMDAVRAEEFINAFDQGYLPPEDGAFAIYADGGPSPFIKQGNYLVRFGVQGYEVRDYARKPLNLTFVIDTSGSMSTDDRLGLVQDSLHLLVDRLDERDMVTIVAFQTEAWLVLEPTNASDRRVINRAIDQLRPDGSTNAGDGLRLGYRYADRMLDPEAVNRVILCSDGVANQGITNVESILELVQGYVDAGITLTSIGVGMGNFNDALLEQLADRGDGNYFYVNTMDEAHKIFVEELTSTMQVIAYDAKIQVDFNPEVVATYRLIGYENRAVADDEFRDDSVDAGEIGAGMTATALYEVSLRDSAQGRIATTQLRWLDSETREPVEINGNFNTFDLANTFEGSSPYFQLASTVAAFAEILRASPYVEGSLLDVAVESKRISAQFEESEEVFEFADYARFASRLSDRAW